MPASPPAPPPSPTFEDLRGGGIKQLAMRLSDDPEGMNIFYQSVGRVLGTIQGAIDDALGGAALPLDEIGAASDRAASRLRVLADAIELAADLLLAAPTATEWRSSQTGGSHLRTFQAPRRTGPPTPWGAPQSPKGGNA